MGEEGEIPSNANHRPFCQRNGRCPRQVCASWLQQLCHQTRRLQSSQCSYGRPTRPSKSWCICSPYEVDSPPQLLIISLPLIHLQALKLLIFEHGVAFSFSTMKKANLYNMDHRWHMGIRFSYFTSPQIQTELQPVLHIKGLICTKDERLCHMVC